MPILPHGERVTDPPRHEQSFTFRFGLMVRRANPITVAFTVALIVCAIPLFMILAQNTRLSSQNERLNKQALQAKHQRFEATALVCDDSSVIQAVLAANPGAEGGGAALARIQKQDCPHLLDEILIDLGKDATRGEVQRATQD